MKLQKTEKALGSLKEQPTAGKHCTFPKKKQKQTKNKNIRNILNGKRSAGNFLKAEPKQNQRPGLVPTKLLK